MFTSLFIISVFVFLLFFTSAEQRRLCFHACWLVCLTLGNITVKYRKGFSMNFQDRFAHCIRIDLESFRDVSVHHLYTRFIYIYIYIYVFMGNTFLFSTLWKIYEMFSIKFSG